MRGTTTILAILLVACGGNGGGQDDTSTDQPEDTLDTQSDTATDTVPDTFEDTPIDTTVDTSPDTVEDTITDTTADTPIDTSIDEAVEEEAPECTLDDDCDNGIFCDGEETCSAEGACQAGTLVTCDDTDPCTTDRCNEDDDECTFDPTDSDGDGYATATGPGGETCPGTDCNDTDNAIFPGALPVACSAVDNDCNGSPDNDSDGDGHVDITCTGGEDCNDSNAGVWSGAWYDPTTGYLWENPSTFGMYWNMADNYCDELSLCGRVAGEWDMPTASELRTLILGCSETASGGVCGVTDSCLSTSCWTSSCSGCSTLGGPGIYGRYSDPALDSGNEYFTSSSVADDPGSMWFVNFNEGLISTFWGMGAEMAVRCVHTP